MTRFFRRLSLGFLCFLVCAPLLAQEAVAPYVTTTREDVQRMLDLADLMPGDVLIDLGSGDGRIPIAAAERGALSFGVEIEAELVDLARDRAKQAGMAERTHFTWDDVFTTPIAHASVVTMYLMPEVNMQLRERLLRELRPGTRVVSNTFTFGDWSADKHIPGRTSGGLLLWIVPADFAGRWRIEGDTDAVLSLKQSFQVLEGEMQWAGQRWEIPQTHIRGARAGWLLQIAGGAALAVSASRVGDALELDFLPISEAEDSLEIDVVGRRVRALRERAAQKVTVP